MSKVLSKVFISLSHNQTANKMAKKYGLKFGAARFVAGNSIENAVKCVRELNQNGMVAMLNYLGEFVSSEDEAAKAADNCIKTLAAIHQSGIDSNLSIKISSLGLDISKEVCLRNLRRILGKAREYGNFVRIEIGKLLVNLIKSKILFQLIF